MTRLEAVNHFLYDQQELLYLSDAIAGAEANATDEASWEEIVLTALEDLIVDEA